MYTIEKANLIAEQLRKFTSGYVHHLAGHFSNIDFWLNEVKQSIETIDEYTSRFNKLRDAQKNWVNAHGTVVYYYCPICGGKCEFADGIPRPPKRMAHSELEIVRRDLKDNAYYFLIRCYNAGLLNLPELKIKCEVIGSSVDPLDLKKRPGDDDFSC